MSERDTNVTTFSNLNFKPHQDGIRAIHKFDNGYSASVIQTPFSYGGKHGLYELAVLSPLGELDYSTSVTDDVEGRLIEDDVTRLLQQIEALPHRFAMPFIPSS